LLLKLTIHCMKPPGVHFLTFFSITKMRRELFSLVCDTNDAVMGLYCHRFLRFSTHSRLGVSIVTLGMGMGACRRSKDSMPLWDNAARTKKIPKGYILWGTHVWVGSAGIWISSTVRRLHLFLAARPYYCVRVRARYARRQEECVSGPLSSSMNDRDRSGMVREKDRTDLFKVQARWHFYLWHGEVWKATNCISSTIAHLLISPIYFHQFFLWLIKVAL
jgi:hypothetical protein